jgi:hypothetical protein
VKQLVRRSRLEGRGISQVFFPVEFLAKKTGSNTYWTLVGRRHCIASSLMAKSKDFPLPYMCA